LTVGAAAPLQQAGAIALELPPSYYEKLAAMYLVKRDRMLAILEEAGFRCFKPSGAYYIMTDISKFGFPDDLSFAKYLVEKIGVAVVPGSSFYDDPAMGARQVRFTFCKKESTLATCAEKLSKLRGL
jgi:aminotransferase